MVEPARGRARALLSQMQGAQPAHGRDERVGVPGFREGRRYEAVPGEGGDRQFFTFYPVDNVGVLSSPVYLARLENPHPDTLKAMRHFRNMMRTVCVNVQEDGDIAELVSGIGDHQVRPCRRPAGPIADRRVHTESLLQPVPLALIHRHRRLLPLSGYSGIPDPAMKPFVSP